MGIVTCLDDGTKRLTPDGPAPAPSPSPSPAPSPSPTPPSKPPLACQGCFNSNCGSVKKSETCKSCVQNSQAKCSSFCKPYPFKDALRWFCGDSTNIQIV